MSRKALIDSLEAALRGIDDATRIDADTAELALAALSDIRTQVREALDEIRDHNRAQVETPHREHFLEEARRLVEDTDSFSDVPDPEISYEDGSAWVEVRVCIPEPLDDDAD